MLSFCAACQHGNFTHEARFQELSDSIHIIQATVNHTASYLETTACAFSIASGLPALMETSAATAPWWASRAQSSGNSDWPPASKNINRRKWGHKKRSDREDNQFLTPWWPVIPRAWWRKDFVLNAVQMNEQHSPIFRPFSCVPGISFSDVPSGLSASQSTWFTDVIL